MDYLISAARDTFQASSLVPDVISQRKGRPRANCIIYFKIITLLFICTSFYLYPFCSEQRILDVLRQLDLNMGQRSRIIFYYSCAA